MKESDRDSVFQNEIQRYQSKGRGAVVATVILCSVIFYWPTMARAFWHWVLDYMEENNMSLYRMYFISGFV